MWPSFSFSRNYLFFFISDFWRFAVLKIGELKVRQSAGFELAQEDSIWFLDRLLNHSAMSARRSAYAYLRASLFVELLLEIILSQSNTFLPFLGAFDRSMSSVVWTEKFQSQQDSNLIWRNLFEFQSKALIALPWLHVRISTFIGVCHCFLNCPVTFFLFLKDLPRFLCFGLSDGLMCCVLVSEKFCCQQDSNLRWKTPSDFLSVPLTTRPWLHDGVFTFICVGLCLLNCRVKLYFLKVLRNYHLFGACDRSMSSVVWTEKLQSQQDSNFIWRNLSEV